MIPVLAATCLPPLTVPLPPLAVAFCPVSDVVGQIHLRESCGSAAVLGASSCNGESVAGGQKRSSRRMLPVKLRAYPCFSNEKP